MDTIPAAVEEAASRFGAAEALVDGPVRLTWRELHDQVRGVTKVFAEGGIKPGDRVAMCAPNTHHWVLTALGALSAGATLVPINTRFTATETADILDRTHAKALVVADDFLGRDRLAELRTGGHRVPDFVLPVSPGTPPLAPKPAPPLVVAGLEPTLSAIVGPDASPIPQ